MKKKDCLYPVVILVIEVLLLAACKIGFGTLVVKGDYLFQHGVIPDIFRKTFYETGKLLPDCIFQLGAGVNTYNLSYYGLLNPIILISYLFPTIKMITFLQTASSILFVSTGILMYIWMRKHYTEEESLLASVIIILAPPVLFGFQNQVVFVECVPFVILSLMAVDKKIETGNNVPLIIAMTLTIFVNYYSSIVSLGCVMIYYGYRYLLLGNRVSARAIWQIVHPVIISVMTAGILLIPTAYVILNGIRADSNTYSLIDLFIIPDYGDTYTTVDMGITMMFVFAAFAVFTCSRRVAGERFLTVCLFLITFCPIVLYALNGGNYIRNKVAIPLWPLWCMLILIMYGKMKERQINYRKSLTVFIVSCGMVAVWKWCGIFFVADAVITVAVVVFCRKTGKYVLCIICTLLIMAGYTVGLELATEHAERFADDEKIEAVTDEILAEDTETYRMGNNIRQVFNTNKIYSFNYMTTSIYTSTQNGYYYNFYSKIFGNNLYFRNYLMLGGSHNPLFNIYMGEKYILEDRELDDADYSLSPLYSGHEIKVYETDSAYPLVYGKNSTVTMKEFNQLPFPYSMDCLMNYGIRDYVEEDDESENLCEESEDDRTLSCEEYSDGGRIQPYGTELIQDSYRIHADESYEYTIDLTEPVTEKYLIIMFKVEQQEEGDLKICINDSRNLLTEGSWYYGNGNYEFKYVISSQGTLKQLKIYIQEGDYNITDVKMYTYDFHPENVEMDKGENINIDYTNSRITADINAGEDEYLVTSFPYDEGYTVYVDGRKAKKEIVNTAFLGCKIQKGEHSVTIVYKSPWKTAGAICSLLGVLFLVAEYIRYRFSCLLFESNRKSSVNVSSTDP